MTLSAGIDPALLRRAFDHFVGAFGAEPVAKIAVAPGRVNLIGEHTDYNDGFVLPMAIGRAIVVVFRPRDDRTLRGHSVAYEETKEMDLDSLTVPGGSDWLSYVAGVAWAFAGEGLPAPGLDVVVDGDIPLRGRPVLLRGAGDGHGPGPRRRRRLSSGIRSGWRS